LDDDLVLFDEVQLPADKILDELRVVMQAVDGPGQPGVFLGKSEVFCLQKVFFLPEAIDLKESPVAEKNEKNQDKNQT
jgi:hypothetical protein